MKFLMFSLFILLMNLLHAADQKTCSVQGAVRCLCKASMTIDCGNDGRGFVINNEKVLGAKLVINNKLTGKMREVKLTENQIGHITARELYVPNYSEEIRKLVSANPNEEINTDTITLDSKAKLYTDSNATYEIPQNSASEMNNCSFVDDVPAVATYRGACGNKKICVARIQCISEQNGGPSVSIAACPAINDNCPTADQCAQDQEIILQDPASMPKVNKSTASPSASK
jgi:hypothetical protein